MHQHGMAVHGFILRDVATCRRFKWQVILDCCLNHPSASWMQYPVMCALLDWTVPLLSCHHWDAASKPSCFRRAESCWLICSHPAMLMSRWRTQSAQPCCLTDSTKTAQD